jgi:hypothetical protein
LAWQRTDRYVPPDPNGFFPDDPQGGRKLDALFQADDKDRRSDAEILSTVRQGFRRMTQDRRLLLVWIGNRYIWGRDPQNPEAVEIMYHAVPLEPHYAVYFGLSVVHDKTANLLRTLAEVCMQGEEVERIVWGVGLQREELLAYITPHLQDSDPDKWELANAIVGHLRNGMGFERWQQERRLRRIRTDLQAYPARFKEALYSGDSSVRYEILKTIVDADTAYPRMDMTGVLDSSFFAPMQAAATDPNPEVRGLVAQVVGNRSLWSTAEDDPNAIELLLALTWDTDREVRHGAVYFGFLWPDNKKESIIRRLVELALTEGEGIIRSRIAMSLGHPKPGQPELVEKVLSERVPWVMFDPPQAASLCQLYRDILGKHPPGEWGLVLIYDRLPDRTDPTSRPRSEASVAAGGRAKREHAQNMISGRVLDPEGNAAAQTQVALCSADRGVSIRGTKLGRLMARRESLVVTTDAQGRFAFPEAPDRFQVIAANETGFAWVDGKELVSSADIRLQPWGRVEGTLRIGRRAGARERVSLLQYSNGKVFEHHVSLGDEVRTDVHGRFMFEKVPPGWLVVGHAVPIGGAAWTITGDLPAHVPSGQTVTVTAGGLGRPVVGRFVPSEGYTTPDNFRMGLYSMSTAQPERPRPDGFDRISIRERQQWYENWRATPQAQAYEKQVRYDPNNRRYHLSIERDGFFRIDDVIPGKYRTIIREQIAAPGHRRETGLYYGTIEVPAMAEPYTDEPLDLGNLVLRPCQNFEIGDVAPPFEAKTLDGRDIRLVDYRGKFVLLNFWYPAYDPGLADLKYLYGTYGAAGKLQFIGLAGFGTLREVEDHIGEHGIQWPQIYCGQGWEVAIVEQYLPPGPSHNLLVDPEGKIVAIGASVSARTIKQALERAQEHTIP